MNKLPSAINVERRVAILGDAVIPITNLFDADGEECGPDEAVSAVAGAGSLWFSLCLSDYHGATTQ